MSELNLRDKSRSFWKALEQINKLSVQERLDLTQLLTTCDYNNPNSKTTYKSGWSACWEGTANELYTDIK
jgi:hypothetical protein